MEKLGQLCSADANGLDSRLKITTRLKAARLDALKIQLVALCVYPIDPATTTLSD
jgi:hypothetical protein